MAHSTLLTRISSAKAKILVFDSGVGGLSVAREIQQRLPGVSLIYASDNGFFPYGTKGEAELIKRVDQVISALLAAYPVDLLVIACNTASTLALPHLRSRLSLPIVGVVPAIKPAAQLTQSRVIGLLATPATVARPYTHELIREYAAECNVICLGSSELVQVAEKKLHGELIDVDAVAQVVRQLMQREKAQEMDVLVLACTHFPLLREELGAHLPDSIRFIDSGEAIARRVDYLLSLQHEEYVDVDHGPSRHVAVFTQRDNEIQKLTPALQLFGIRQIAFIDVV